MPQPCHQTSWQWWQTYAYCGQKCRHSRLEPIPKNEIQSEASRVGVPVWDSVPSKANATTGWCLCLPCPVQIALVLKFCPGLIEKHGGNAATPQTPRECCWKPQGIGSLQPCGSTQVPAVEGFPVSGKGTPPGGHSVLGHVVPRDFFRETQVGRHAYSSLYYHDEPHSKHLQNKHRTHVKRKRCRKQGQNCWRCKKYPQSYTLGFV